MAMNRTAEFAELCAAMSRSPTATDTPSPSTCPVYVRQMTEAGALISERAFDAKSKLEHLGTLVSTSSLFSDPAEQIAMLISAVNDEIGAAAHELQLARRLIEAPRLRDAGREGYRHCAAVESQLRIELDDVSRDFKQLLQLRSESVRKRTERRELFGSKREDRAQRARVPKFEEEDPLPRPHEATASSGVEPYDLDSRRRQTQQQLQQLQPLIPDESYLSARADAASDIEAQVQEVGNIFSKVTKLISEQNESVERIESNVEDAVSNVDRGTDALRRGLSDMSSNTATALKVGGIICATLVVYVVLV